MRKLIPFINSISEFQSTLLVFNPYLHPSRQHNLSRYLQQIITAKPRIFMLMEAPGYRGCRITGIPVTSRKIMLESMPNISVFGEGYKDILEAGFEYYSEQSSTIVWTLLSQLNVTPFVWNAFPFHPHEYNKLQTNRTPTQAEIEMGLPFVQQTLQLSEADIVVAVGNIAEKSLTMLNIPYTKVRHPAQGGKSEFVNGLKKIIETL
jgi:uracil-DNA glycosylase